MKSRAAEVFSKRLHVSNRPRWTVSIAILAIVLLTTNPLAGQTPTTFDHSPTAGYRLPEQDLGVESLFDGRTLEGWSGLAGHWSVEDRAITGQTTADRPIDGNTFLIWQGGELGDFELRLQFRIEAGNSGVQYRSQNLGDHRVGGYQADIDADHQYIGILYEERGRGILALRGNRVVIDSDGTKDVHEQVFSESQLLQSLRKNDWNQYVIQALGNRLTHTLNGHTSIEVIDRQTDASQLRGILALQLHAGPPMKVQFKDILLKRLDATSPASESIESSGCTCLSIDPCRCVPMAGTCRLRPRSRMGIRRCCR